MAQGEIVRVRGNLVVLDIGKTLSKLSLWTPEGELLERRERRNQRCYSGGRLVLDVNGIEEWLTEALGDLPGKERIGGIIPIGHGAAAALIRDGALAAPPPDYESPVASQVRDAYEGERDPFTETGSPALPDGLNLGIQLYRLERSHPELFDQRTQILTWPQYWSWLLSGVAATEVTSLGCHTDLWNPAAAAPSKMAICRGWAKLLAPLRPAGEALGRLRREWVSRTGLPQSVQVYCGIHDSNAALVAARAHRELAHGELTVLSTGTWFVAMRSLAASAPFSPRLMPEGQDVLVNVDIDRTPVPSARFMGGREIHLLTALASRQIDIPADQPAMLGAAASVLSRGAMVLPTLAPGCGPFPKAKGGWVEKPEEPLELRAAASLYVALMTDAMLELIGARRDLLVEGRFAAAELFVRALAQLRPDLRVFTSSANADVAQGALKLVYGRELPEGTLRPVSALNLELSPYRARWRAEVGKLEARA
jgi:sugar (pentulose or hexulose) kinase